MPNVKHNIDKMKAVDPGTALGLVCVCVLVPVYSSAACSCKTHLSTFAYTISLFPVMKALHSLLFGRAGTKLTTKKNLRAFSGFVDENKVLSPFTPGSQ
jgi:hypothetical protein